METQMLLTVMGTGYTKNWNTAHDFRTDRLYYIHSGSGGYICDGTPHPFLVGHLYYLPCRAVFSLYQDESDPLDHTFINFVDCRFCRHHRVIDIVPADDPIIEVLAQMMVSLIVQLSKEHHPGFFLIPRGNGIQIPCIDVISACLRELLERISSPDSATDRLDEDIARVLTYIHEHYREKLTLDALASIACLNKRYFIAKFRDAMDCTPYQYIQSLRYDIAMLLCTHGMSGRKAAEKVGFGSSSSFYRIQDKHD